MEKPKYRAAGDIDQEYSNICTQIGDREYKISVLQTEINQFKARCRELADEKTALPKQEAPANGVTPTNQQ